MTYTDNDSTGWARGTNDPITIDAGDFFTAGGWQREAIADSLAITHETSDSAILSIACYEVAAAVEENPHQIVTGAYEYLCDLRDSL